jgi:hypothetical protein
MRIIIDPEGADYTTHELISLSVGIQKVWDSMGRGMKEVFSMTIDNSYSTNEELKKLNQQEMEKTMLKANTGDMQVSPVKQMKRS